MRPLLPFAFAAMLLSLAVPAFAESTPAPATISITGEGKGGIVGFAKGGADVSLADNGSGATVLTYVVRAEVGGKIAQLGSRLIDSTAKKLAGQFFSTFGEKVGAIIA